MLAAAGFVHAQVYNTSTDIYDQDIARNVQYDPFDGGHVTTGFSNLPTAATGTVANLVKYDATGAAVWAHTYDFGTGDSRGNAVEKTADGGYIIAGHATSPISGLPSAILIKTDVAGNLMWSQYYDYSTSYSEAFSVEEIIFPLIGPTYAVTGSFKNPASGTLDIFVFLTDPFGNIISNSEFDTGADEEGLSIKPGPAFSGIAGPAYVVSGYSTIGGMGNKNVFVCGLDFALNMVWGEVYGGPGDEEGRALEVSPAGNILVGGYSNSFSNGRQDVFVSLLNSAGAPLWQNIYGLKKDEEAYSVEFISDGTIAVTGWTNQLSAAGNTDAFLFKTDLAGTLLFSRAYGGADNDIGYSIKESISTTGVGGGLIMAGAYGINPAVVFDDRDIYTVRTNAAGLAPCAKNPKFRQLAVTPIFNAFVLPANNTAFNNNLAPADPFVPFTQQNRCCTCADMVVSFTYSPSIFCSGTTVNFINTSTCVDNFRWLVNGVLVGSTANLSYVFATPGIYTVTLQGNNAGCVALSFSQTILVSCGPAPRLEDELSTSPLQLSPNPAITQVTLQADLGEGAAESAQVLVLDMTGRVVYTQNHPVDGQHLNLQLSTADWSEGLYLVQVQSGTFEQTQRLMVAH
jgi:hypothetical protein